MRRLRELKKSTYCIIGGHHWRGTQLQTAKHVLFLVRATGSQDKEILRCLEHQIIKIIP